jgi:hypothetical protein
MIKAGLSSEIPEVRSPVVAAEIGVCRVPVPPEVIVVAVRWYLRDNLCYRDVEELLIDRGARSTTARYCGGCNASRHCWPTPPGSLATHRVTAGSSTKRR